MEERLNELKANRAKVIQQLSEIDWLIKGYEGALENKEGEEEAEEVSE